MTKRNKPKLGIYKHYSGKLYELIDVALNTETEEKMVLYRALYDIPSLEEKYGKRPIFARAFDMFFEKIIIDGKEQERFKFIK